VLDRFELSPGRRIHDRSMTRLLSEHTQLPHSARARVA
jgi:hypothetical protein